MSEELTIESLAAEIAAADQQEHPPVEDSSPEGAQTTAEEGAQDDAQDAGAEESANGGQDGHPETDPAEEDPIVEWTTASGEAFKVPRSELQKGYLRQADYTQKAQTLAEERKQAQAAIQQQFEAMQALGAELGEVQAVSQRIEAYKQLDWNSLRMQDPQRYNDLRIELHDLQEQQREAASRLQARGQAVAQQRMQADQQRMQAGLDYLKAKVPEFSDAWLANLREQAVRAGYTADDLNGIYSGRVLEDMWKARQWDALQAKKPEVQNRLKAAPPASARKPAQQAAPTSRQEQVLKAIDSKRAFSTDEFARLMAAAR